MGVFIMSREKKVTILVFILATLAGSALHFLYSAFPNPLTAVLAPVDESIWEHGKLILWPGVLSAALLTKLYGKGAQRFAAVTLGLVILVVWGFLYNIVLKGPWDFVNILSYVAEMAFIFWLPCRSTPQTP